MLKFPVSELETSRPRPPRKRDALETCIIPIHPCVHSLRKFSTTEKRFVHIKKFSAALLACIDQALFANDISAIAALTELDHDERFRRIPEALLGEHEACVEVAKALDELACSAHARAVRALSAKPVGPTWITGGDPAEEILDRLQNGPRKPLRKQRQ
jgi:hypothetical protein